MGKMQTVFKNDKLGKDLEEKLGSVKLIGNKFSIPPIWNLNLNQK